MKSAGTSPYQWATNRDGYRVLIRNKHPRFAIEVQDDAYDRQLANALRKAAEFVSKEHHSVERTMTFRGVYRKNGKLFTADMEDKESHEGAEFVGKVCDEECSTSCAPFRNGTCPDVPTRMSDGELVKMLEI